MNQESGTAPEVRHGVPDRVDARPILLVPYMWIGDFVRCHTVVRVLNERWPARPVDVLATTLTAPLADYMPGVRKAVVVDLPRRRLPPRAYWTLARTIRSEHYGTALVMPRTWKAGLAPFLARIPERVGFFGEARLGLLNDLRWGERRLPRMIDRCAALALPRGATLPAHWPEPALRVPQAELACWGVRRGLDGSRGVVALAPGAVGPSKRWPAEYFATLAGRLGAAGLEVWVLGGPGERELAQAIVAQSGGAAQDLTGPDLREAVLALANAKAVVSNDSGLLHVAAALGRPSIGIFGPTSPFHWAPLNPLAAVIKTIEDLPCQPCHKPVCQVGHHGCMRMLEPDRAFEATMAALDGRATGPAAADSAPAA